MNKNNSYHKKIVHSLLLVSLIPLSIFAIFIYFSSIGKYSENLDYDSRQSFNVSSNGAKSLEDKTIITLNQVRSNTALIHSFNEDLSFSETLTNYDSYAKKNIEWLNMLSPEHIKSIVFYTTKRNYPKGAFVSSIPDDFQYTNQLLDEDNMFVPPIVSMDDTAECYLYYPYAPTAFLRFTIDWTVFLDLYKNENNYYRYYVKYLDSYFYYDAATSTLTLDNAAYDKDISSKHVTVLQSDELFDGFRIIGIRNDSAFFRQANIIRVSFIVISLLFFMALFFIIMFLSNNLTKRISSAINLIKNTDAGSNAVLIPEDSNDDEINLLIHHINNLTRSVINSQSKRYELELELKTTQINALQKQISPHFLYNTLENFKMIAMINNQKELSEGLTQLGRLLRYYSKINDSVSTLEAEMMNIYDYLKIENLIFMNTISYKIDIPEELMHCKIPSIILQPIVENSIKHGKKRGMPIEITISAYIKLEDLVITVSDNGVGMPEDEINKINIDFSEKHWLSNSTSKIGLNNVNQRIKIMTDETYGISLKPNSPNGLTTIIDLPRIK